MKLIKENINAQHARPPPLPPLNLNYFTGKMQTLPPSAERFLWKLNKLL